MLALVALLFIYICKIILKSDIMELHIKSKIFQIRNQYILLDKDLADLYQLPTKRINEAVKRNINRFPKDFMFQLTQQEW